MESDLLSKVIFYLVMLFCISWHECAHALVASWCGDRTARDMGRVTLSPIPHMDLFGTLIIPLINIFSSGSFALIGWGKPVLVDVRNFRHPVRDDILVSLAGPFSNFLLCLAVLLSTRLLPLFSEAYAASLFQYVILPMAATNAILCFFNLFPLPPLDGSHLLFYLLPARMRPAYGKVAVLSMVIMLVLINTPLWQSFSRAVMTLLFLGFKYVGGLN